MVKFVDSISPTKLVGKKVLLRVDFNVSIKEEKFSNGRKQIGIADDFKIRAQRETIYYLLKSGAKILLVSHLDTINSFLPIVEEIGEIIGQTISLVPHAELNSLGILFKTGQILLLDNIRQDKREEKNSEELAEELSKTFDFFVNNAFAVSHRRHASVVVITKFLPSYAGFLIKKETENLNEAIRVKTEGKVLVLGGAKISTKLPVIQNFLAKAEKILLGGALANDFWCQQGINVGASLVDDSSASQLGNLVSKLVLPSDILVSKGWILEQVKNFVAQDAIDRSNLKGEPYVSEVRNLEIDEAIVDIGPESAENFAEMIKKAEMVIWNGPMGLSEVDKFAHGTAVVARAVAGAKYSMIGGGETIEAAARLGLLDKYSYISTGGGAMLEFLAGNRLPGLEALGYYD